MNIGIDARIIERRITGIGRSLLILLDELPLLDKSNNYFLFSYGKLNINDMFFQNITTIKSFIPQKLYSPIWSNLILPFYLKRNKIDIHFSINQVIPLIKVKNCKYISVVHDVIYKADSSFLPLIYRKYLQLFAYFSIKSSDLIITVSEYSKKDILKNYKISEDKIRVILQTAKKEFQPLYLSEEEIKGIKNSLGLPELIVLYVGMIENRKNIYGILSVADILKERYNNLAFLLIGKKGHGGDKIINEVKKRQNVIYLNNIDDTLLKKIYNIANVFLFPSHYEGFGYPPLEAMQSGLPVLASNNTSLMEIIDTAGLLHDPDDYEAFAKDIIKLLSDKTLYNLMKLKGIERAKKFEKNNWSRQIVKVFNSFKCSETNK
jgi:glycosyltransferase involved in cell wall biosynthesis